MGPTPWQGGRIKYFRPHWFAAMKAHAEDASLYGSEQEKWDHNAILHPINALRDPYWLEKKHYLDRRIRSRRRPSPTCPWSGRCWPPRSAFFLVRWARIRSTSATTASS
jgi:hypothetical protein